MKKQKLPRISTGEWQVMNAVWKSPSCTAQEIIDAVGPANDWAPVTVKTLISRLSRKGALAIDKSGELYRYRATLNEEDCRIAEAKSFLNRVFDGSLSPMLSHFVKSKQLSAEEIGELKRILRQGRL